MVQDTKAVKTHRKSKLLKTDHSTGQTVLVNSVLALNRGLIPETFYPDWSAKNVTETPAGFAEFENINEGGRSNITQPTTTTPGGCQVFRANYFTLCKVSYVLIIYFCKK